LASEPDRVRPARLDDLSPVRFGAWLAAFFGLGLFERLLVPGPPATLSLTDAYYYGRLAWLSRLSFPAPVTFDTWTGYPGMEVQWPPGHAWLLAAMQALFGVKAPFSADGLAALAWSGPLLSLLGIGVLVAVAARWVGRWAALVLAGALLVQPLVADVGQFGEADHHLHEAFFGAAIALLFVRAAGGGRHSPLRAGLTLGVVAALPYLFTSSGFLFLPPLAGAVFLTLLVPSPHRLRQTVLFASACASSLVVVALGAAWLGRLGAADYVRLSGFHVGLHAAMLLCFAALLVVLAPVRALRRAALGLGLAALAVASWMGPAIVAEVHRALGHLGRGSAILSVAEESSPLFATDLNLALSQTLVPAVVALLAAAALHWRARRTLAWLVPMAGWLAIFAAATGAQARFARPLTPIAAVLAGVLVQRFMSTRTPGRLAGITARLAAVALLVPPPVVLSAYSDEPARFVQGLAPALAWMRENTPSAGDPTKPSQRPAWAVLAEWQLGHLITALAQRPVLASPFGQTPEAEHAAALARDILKQRSSEEALRTCLEHGLRYLVLYDPAPDPKSAPPLSLRRKLASGAPVPGFRPVYVGQLADQGRIPRIFEIAAP
jgi:dolichyl-diphosphooligosaccharide--protein glycosyltransferase